MRAASVRDLTVAGLLSLAAVAALLWHFHDRFWWPVDEGVYAYVAQRLLAGDVLHRDLVDLHGGYGNLINALAFALFGEDLRALRYPLVLATLAQAAIVFRLLAPCGALAAGAGAIAVGAFSFVQFPNPSANWYALLVFFLMALLLERGDPRRARTLLLAGVLLGMCFLVRQLSGVILAVGTVSWLLLRVPASGAGGSWAGRMLGLVMIAGLGGYLASKQSLFAVAWFGGWPLALLVLVALRARLRPAEVGRMAGLLGLGALTAALPLAVHHALAGAFAAWLRDVFVTPLLIHGQDFIGEASFATVLLAAAAGLLQPGEPITALNGGFWILVLAAFPLTGALTLRHVARTGTAPGALPVLATFWGVVAVHYQIPVYLFFALPATLAALLQLQPRRGVASAAIGLAAWAVAFHAGQPLSRGLAGAVEGRRVPLDAEAGLPRASLRMEAADQLLYATLLARIAEGAAADEPLMTLPMEPELNFMTRRPAPVPYYGTPLGLRTAADVADSLARLRAAAPLFVVHRREDKYLTPLSADLLAGIRVLAPPPERFGPFDLYRLPAPPPSRADR